VGRFGWDLHRVTLCRDNYFAAENEFDLTINNVECLGIFCMLMGWQDELCGQVILGHAERSTRVCRRNLHKGMAAFSFEVTAFTGFNIGNLVLQK
jgi:hypothetical protein